MFIDGRKNAEIINQGFSLNKIVKPVTIFILFLESILLIKFLLDNDVWITETGKDKPSRYKNFIDFLRIIFLSQVLMLQVDLNSQQYPILALNVLLFVFWITSYVMLIVMLDKQKIY